MDVFANLRLSTSTLLNTTVTATCEYCCKLQMRLNNSRSLCKRSGCKCFLRGAGQYRDTSKINTKAVMLCGRFLQKL